MKKYYTVAARASKLSQAQVKEVEEEIRKFHPEIFLEPLWVTTTGDKDLSTSLRTLDKSDFFTREIDALLLQEKCRIAVHSAKDLPEPLPEGLKIVALTQGVDPSDSLVMPEGKSLTSLPKGARIGVSSLRREKKIQELRADFVGIDIRGTIDARLEILNSGKIDALIVAEAALIRLGLNHLNRLKLEGETAPLQGKLAILARSDDLEMEELFSLLDTTIFS
jgi:hydroxymethylbilane synthase